MPPSQQPPDWDSDSGVLDEQEIRIARPRRYRVLLHNDDYTTMEFVVEVLEQVFHKAPAEAHDIMMNVHRMGIGVAGVYSREVAETKVETVADLAKDAGYPLLCTMEPEEN